MTKVMGVLSLYHKCNGYKLSVLTTLTPPQAHGFSRERFTARQYFLLMIEKTMLLKNAVKEVQMNEIYRR